MKTLSDIIAYFIPGDWGQEKKSEDYENKVFCIRGADIDNMNCGIFSSIPVRYVTTKSLEKCSLNPENIIIEKSGGSPSQSTGRVAYVSKNCIKNLNHVVCSNFCEAFSVKPEWDSQYIYYYLQNIYNSGAFFNFEGKTTGIKNLLLEVAFKSISINDIAKEKQKNIASLLSLIDKKIALNTKINHNLEAVARQLYDYWFVQFDFPDEDGRPYKSSGGKMVWNEKLKREIPKNWKCTSLLEMVDITNGATPSTIDGKNYGGDVVWITPKDLSDQKCKFVEHGQRNITQKGFNSCSTHLLPIGTLLLSSRAPIGLLSIAKTELCTNQGFKNLIPKQKKDTNYLFYYILSHISQIEQLGTGTTFKEVSKDKLSSFPVLQVANDTIYSKWCNISEILFRQQYKITKEISSLTQLRDKLLPLLMNGQVTVNYDLSD